MRGNNLEIQLSTEKPTIMTLSRFDESLAFFREKTKNNDFIIHTLVTHSRKGLASYEFFGIPHVLSIGNWYTWKDLHSYIELICKEVTIKTYYTSKSSPQNISMYLLKKSDMKCALCTKEKCSGCEIPKTNGKLTWLEQRQNSVFICIFWRNPGLYKYVIIREIEDLSMFDINQCLQKFTESEILEAKCEKCGHNSKATQTEV